MSNFMSELKNPICEALLLLLHENHEVGANFTIFFEAELLGSGYLTDNF
jgi:hypothetical protein